jgi:hypothetical protein
MKKLVIGLSLCALVIVFVTAPADAQRKYTNADLEKFRLEGAYTNEDLRGLTSYPVQERPLYEYPEVDLVTPYIRAQQALEARAASLRSERDRLQAELDYRAGILETAYSARGGEVPNFRNLAVRDQYLAPYPGTYSQMVPRLEYLLRRISLVNRQLAELTR